MPVDYDHPQMKKEFLSGPPGLIARFVASRAFLFFSDYFMMKNELGQRGRQLAQDHIVCRFCGNPIELLGAWKCECEFKRPGNYFGRCPKCLKHPVYIDCPACRFTMDVR